MKKLKADAESRGFTYVDWNVCAEDSLGGHPSASTIYNNIIREVGDKNTCVLMPHPPHYNIKPYPTPPPSFLFSSRIFFFFLRYRDTI